MRLVLDNDSPWEENSFCHFYILKFAAASFNLLEKLFGVDRLRLIWKLSGGTHKS